MREIGRTLDLHYSDYFDFQMMILPRVNERTAEVNVIDAGANMRWSSNLVARGFQRLYRRQQQAYRPSQLVESLITRLERVALE